MLLITIILLICGFWLWKRQKCNPNEPPLYPGAIPVIGHAHRIIYNTKDVWENIIEVVGELKKSDGVLLVKLGPVNGYVASDPDDCLTISNACLQKNMIYDLMKPLLGEGLITGALPIWKVHRKLLGPAFSQVVLNGFIEVLNKQALRLVDDFAVKVGRGPFDHLVYLRNNALQTICMTAMGMDYTNETFSANEYRLAMDQIHDAAINRIQRVWLYHPALYKLSDWSKKQDASLKVLHGTSNTILMKRKEEYFKNNGSVINKKEKPDCIKIVGVQFKPFMDLLLELSIVQGELNNQEIIEEINTMIAAGHETVATGLAFTMLLIGSYPHVQDRIYKELRDVFGDDDRDVTKQDLSKLVYIEAVLKESLRIFPIIPVIARHLDKDVKLRNCTLSSGRSCFIFLYGMHHHPMWGPDVEEFRPERWLDPASLPTIATAFAAFSMGRRTCIGKTYAYMTMKTTLAQVMRHYKIKGDHSKVKLEMDIVLKPVSGHFITVESRNNNI